MGNEILFHILTWVPSKAAITNKWSEDWVHWWSVRSESLATTDVKDGIAGLISDIKLQHWHIQ